MADERGKALSKRFQSSVSMEPDKPDTNQFFPNLGSPISPLRGAVPGVTTSSSSSSGSFSSKHTANAASSSSSPGPAAASARRQDSAAGRSSHSGELSGSSDGSPRGPSQGHRRSASSTASSPAANVLPVGNICPSGRIGKMAPAKPARADVLGHGTGNYGHGSVMRGGSRLVPTAAPATAGSAVRRDPEEVTRAGNEMFKNGHLADALRQYDLAVAMCPDNARCRANRAAALSGLGRIGEAASECEAAMRIDPSYGRVHQRLFSLYLRLGQVEDARKHLQLTGYCPNSDELQKLQEVEMHLTRAADARKVTDWKTTLRESDAAIAAGADSSPLLSAMRAEALLHLHHLQEADSTLQKASQLITSVRSMQTKYLNMQSDCFFHIVKAQVEMALGRFDDAVASAEKARQIDSRNVEVFSVLDNVKAVLRARNYGNELFNSGKFAEACSAYAEGLKFDATNSVLHCNRAACRSKLGQWDKALEECNEALKVHPNYTKALLRRAASYCKLERWAEAVRDYEVLRKELPDDKKVAEDLFHAQVALKTSRGEQISNLKFGGEVEDITSLEQFRAAMSLPGVSVVHFMTASNQQCMKLTPFFEELCSRFPSVNFLKVDVFENAVVANSESVRIVPTFKIYKNGTRVKEMICPSHQVLEYSVRHYSL